MRYTTILGLMILAAAQGADRRVSQTPGTDTHVSMPEYKTLAEWEARKAHLRRQILSAAGLLPAPERNPLNAKIFGRIEHKDYSIEKVYLETLPGYYLGGNLYRPVGRSGRFPGVLTPHGHWTYGRLENQEAFSGPALGLSLARQGYVALAYDMVGYTDTVQTPHAFGGQAEQLWSFGPLGLQLWNSMRALDFLETLAEVDPARLAATGASGGGTQTFLLAAVDERVRYSAPVNMVSASMQGGSPCENAPGLRFDTSNLEFAAMMAPRPMLLVSATGDWTKNVPREEYPAIRRIYELYGQGDNVEVTQMDAGHNYNRSSREAVYRFFGRRVLGLADAAKISEGKVTAEKLQDMLVFHGRPLPENALSYEALFAQWREMSRRQSAAEKDLSALRDRLALALGVEWPAGVTSHAEGDQLILSRSGRGDRVAARWKPGSGAPLLLIKEDKETASSGRPVLVVDVFNAKRDQSVRHFLTFNRSDDANRVQDVLTALAFLNLKAPGKVELRAEGTARLWCLFAAAIAPVPVKLTVDLAGVGGSDADFISGLFAPGVQRAGGLESALRLVSSSK